MVITGRPSSELGTGVAIGDLNNDGVADIIVGAPDPISGSPAGQTYVRFGPLAPPITPTTRLAPTATDVTSNGPSSNDRSGTDLAVGDINNDGIPDILIGAKGASASGEAYVVFGPLSAGTLQLATDADVAITGRPSSELGTGVAIGDLNNDGVADIIVGAPDPISGSPAGQTYVRFGPLSPAAIPTPTPTPASTATATATPTASPPLPPTATPTPTSIPGISQTGLVVLAGLLLAASLWSAHGRRRRIGTSA